MTDAFGQATATELARPDFAALAESFDVPARIASAATVGAVVEETFGTRGPAVVVRLRTSRCSPPPRKVTMGKPLDIAIIVVYLVAMLAFGFWGRTRTKDSADFLSPARRLARSCTRHDGRRGARRCVDGRRRRAGLQVGPVGHVAGGGVSRSGSSR